jgi:acyl carrier protein
MAMREDLSMFIAERLLQDRTATIDPEENLLDRGAIDSVGLLNLITFVEQQTGIRVPEDEMIPENFESVVAIEAFVGRMKGGA